MSAPPFNPIVGNGGFETGLLAPWIPSDVTAATIGNGTQAFAGNYYLNLETAPGNRANYVHQPLRELDTSTTYTVTAQVWGPEVATANYCSVWVHIGQNASAGLIDSATLDYEQSHQWLALEGQFQPQQETEELYLRAGCTLSGASHTLVVLWDAITVAPSPVLD
ncbi:hypothetical protein BJX76DRAFT_357347 [Aspergillus varians]